MGQLVPLLVASNLDRQPSLHQAWALFTLHRFAIVEYRLPWIRAALGKCRQLARILKYFLDRYV